MIAGVSPVWEVGSSRCAPGASTCDVVSGTDARVSFGRRFNLILTRTGPGRVISQPAGIDCPGVCTAAFVEGSTVALAPTATGDAIPFWSGAGNACSTQPTCQLPVSGDTAVTVDFRVPLTVQIDGAGGTVSSDPLGIDKCGDTCTGYFTDGAPVVLTATPGAGFDRPSWSSPKCTTGALTCQVVAGDTIVVEFPQQQNLGVSVNIVAGSGGVTSVPAALNCSPTFCSGSFPPGDVTLTATGTGGWGNPLWSTCGLGASCVIAAGSPTVNLSFVDTTPPQFGSPSVESIGLDTVVFRITVSASDPETPINTGSLDGTFTITRPVSCNNPPNQPPRTETEAGSVTNSAPSVTMQIQHGAGSCGHDNGDGTGSCCRPESMTVEYSAIVTNQAGLSARLCGDRQGPHAC